MRFPQALSVRMYILLIFCDERSCAIVWPQGATRPQLGPRLVHPAGIHPISRIADLRVEMCGFYRAMLPISQYCYGKLSVRLPVTLRYRGHIGWNSWKVIPRLISLTLPLSADPNITDVLQREHPQIFAWIGVGYGKIGSRRTKPAISPKRLKIKRKLGLYY